MSDETALIKLARLVHSVRYEDLPADVVSHAKALILDTIGCAYGAFNSDVGVAVRSFASDLGGHPQSAILGTQTRTSMSLATFANGSMLRYLDANDYYFGRDPAHPSGNLAAALAVGEYMRCSGAELIAAFVAAYEVQLRFCDLAGKPTIWRRGWHHATNAQFSSSAVAARLLKGDVRQTAHAMAIAGSHHNTLAALLSGEISMIKGTVDAWIAKGGVEAATLALRDVTGPLALLEGKHGWAEAVAGEVDFEALLAPIDRYRMMNSCIKGYPVVANAIAPVRAAIELHPEVRGRADSIQRMIVRMPAYAFETPCGNPDRRFPATRESADHSFYYCPAVALLDGKCGDEQFSEEKRTMPALLELLRKVELEADPTLTSRWPGAAGGIVVLQMSDGRVHESHCDYPPGHSRNPLTVDELRAKFHDFADPVLSRNRANRLREQLETLEAYSDVRSLSVTSS